MPPMAYRGPADVRVAVSDREWDARLVAAGELPKWLVISLVLSPAMPLIGLGLLKAAEPGESWTSVAPFVLVATLAVAVILAAYRARDTAYLATARPEWPKTRRRFLLYILGLASLPVTLLVVALVLLAMEWWLAAGVILAITIPFGLLRGFLVTVAWSDLHSSEAESDIAEKPSE